MAYVAPPTFVTGLPLTSTQLNILSDNEADLDARTTIVVDTDGATKTTASTSYVGLGTGPSVSAPIGANGKAQVTLYSSLQGDTVGMLVLVSYKITGAFTYGPLDHDAVTYQVANVLYSARYGATHVADTGAVAPGSPRRVCTFTMQYKVTGPAGCIGSFVDGRITVTPSGG